MNTDITPADLDELERLYERVKLAEDASRRAYREREDHARAVRDVTVAYSLWHQGLARRSRGLIAAAREMMRLRRELGDVVAEAEKWIRTTKGWTRVGFFIDGIGNRHVCRLYVQRDGTRWSTRLRFEHDRLDRFLATQPTAEAAMAAADKEIAPLVGGAPSAPT